MLHPSINHYGTVPQRDVRATPPTPTAAATSVPAARIVSVPLGKEGTHSAPLYGRFSILPEWKKLPVLSDEESQLMWLEADYALRSTASSGRA